MPRQRPPEMAAASRTVGFVRVRRAGESDLDAMVEVMYAEPGVEQMAFMPSISGGRRFSRTMWSLAGISEFVVADDEGDVAGFAWLSEQHISAWTGARAAVAGWGPTGPIRLALKGWPRQLVEIPMPPGPKLIELQVHPVRRGEGTGTTLLQHIIELVGDRPLSLTTRSDNPRDISTNDTGSVSPPRNRIEATRSGPVRRVASSWSGRRAKCENPVALRGHLCADRSGYSSAITRWLMVAGRRTRRDVETRTRTAPAANRQACPRRQTARRTV